MFNTISNAHKDFFEKFCGEISNDISRVMTGEADWNSEQHTKAKVRLVAGAKLAFLTSMALGGILAMGAVSSLLSGAVLLGSINAIGAALIIILAHDGYVALKNEQSNLYAFKVVGKTIWQTVSQFFGGKEVADDDNIMNSRIKVTFQNTWFEPLWISLAQLIHSKAKA